MNIGVKLKALRRLKGLTQEQLAEKINKTRSLVSHVEKSGKVHRDTFLVILEALGVSEYEFSVYDPNRNVIIAEPQGNFTTEKKALQERIDQLERDLRLLTSQNELQQKLIQLLEEKNGKVSKKI